MRDHAKLRAFELADNVAVLIYQFSLGKRLGYVNERDVPECEAKMVETQKVLGALLRSMRNANSLQPTA